MGSVQKDKREAAKRAYIAQGLTEWSKAMIKAGYKESYARVHGSRILSEIREAGELDGIREELEKKAAIAAGVTIAEVIDNARWLIEYGRGGVDGTGNKHGTDVAAGNAQLGKIIGAFKDVYEESGGELRITAEEWAERQLEEAETARKVLRFGDALAVQVPYVKTGKPLLA